MASKRTATLVFVGAGLIAGVWLASGSTAIRETTVTLPAARTTGLDDRGARLAEEISRLHDHLRPSTTPRQPGRNLFSYQRRQAVAPPAQPTPPLPPAQPALLKPPPPRIKLSGIAEDTTPDGVVRTAIVSAFGQLFVVKEGESITSRYRVQKISADVLELSDDVDGSVLRIALP